jgi:hypothetical protein
MPLQIPYVLAAPCAINGSHLSDQTRLPPTRRIITFSTAIKDKARSCRVSTNY